MRLDSVIIDITGVTGQRILRAIIDGERDPYRLAELRDGQITRPVSDSPLFVSSLCVVDID